MTIAEKLNKIDHYCLDNNKDFRDLRSLYESIKPKLSAQDRTDLKKFISNPNANAEDIEIKLQSLSNKNEAIDPKCLEKKSLDEAKYMGYNYPYEVHWINHHGNDVLLGANKELFQAELTARNQIKQLLSNPWMSDKDKLLTLENVYIYNSETGDEDCMTDDLMWFIEKARDRLKKKTESLDESVFDDFEDDTDSVFVEVDHKQVHDSSGFITDYTMYQNTDTGEFVCVFGDTDLYRPEDGEWDAGPFETEEEAWEWFDCYNGFDDEDLDESVDKMDEYYDPIEDIDSADMIGKLTPGDKFKNRKGVVITIVEPQKDGTVQFQVGDEVHSGSEKSIQRMLYRNNYMRIDDIDESLIMPDGTTFTKPIWYKNYKIKQNRSSDEFLSVFDEFGEVESDGFTSVEAAKEYIDNLIEDAMYDDWQSGNVGKFNKDPDDDFDEPLPFEGYSKKKDTSKSLNEFMTDDDVEDAILNNKPFDMDSFKRYMGDTDENKLASGAVRVEDVNVGDYIQIDFSSEEVDVGTVVRIDNIRDSDDEWKRYCALTLDCTDMDRNRPVELHYDPDEFIGYKVDNNSQNESLKESIDDEKLNVVIYSDERPQQVISGNGFKTIQVRDKLDWFSAPLAEVYEEMKNFYSDPYYDGCTCTVSGKGWSAPLQDVLDYYENKDSYLGESYADIFSGVGAAAGTALGGITPIPFDEVAGASVGSAAGRAIGGVFDAIHQHRQNKAKRDDGVYEALEIGSDEISSAINAIKTASLEHDLGTEYISGKPAFTFGDPKRGLFIKIQDLESREHNFINKQPKVSSKSWGRIWQDGELLTQFEGPKNVVRQDMINYLKDMKSNNMNESLNEAYDGYNHVAQLSFDVAVNDPQDAETILDYIVELFDTYSINNALEVECRLEGADITSMDHAYNESLKEAKEDEGWSYNEILTFLKDHTKNFTKEGTIKTFYETEKDNAKNILKKYYSVVEPSDGRTSKDDEMCWVIAYSNPKQK